MLYLKQLPRFNKIVANPPYSISSPLLLRILFLPFEKAVLTFQKDFVKKITAQKGERSYGRLSIIAQYKVDTEILEFVPKNSFYPPPRVESAVVRMKLREPSIQVEDEAFFLDLINFIFTQKKKKLRNTLSMFVELINSQL